MKTLLLCTAVLFNLEIFGQAIPNGGFENWNSTSYNEVTGWNSGNLRDIQAMGMPSITKVNGFTGFAIRIQTNIIGPDTSESYVINTVNPCNDPPQWKGGVPYSQQPTAITGHYRYNLLGTDTALLIVIFRKNGAHVGDNYIKIRGTGSQSVFTTFSFPLTCSVVPDTMIIAAASSNKISNPAAQNGSFIEFDDLAFANCTQPILNGTFENWTAKTYDVPVSFESWGTITKSTGSYSGSFALRLETALGMCNSSADPSGITNGYMTPNNGPRGGTPYSLQMDTLCGYYKYSTPGNDSAKIYVNLSVNGNQIGGNTKDLVPAATYTFFKIPFSAGLPPDTIRIDAMSSNWNSPVLGSVLYLDNLYLKSQPLGIKNLQFITSQINVYPNPVKDLLTIDCNTVFSPKEFVLYNSIGEMIISGSNISNLVHVNMKDLPDGIYFLQLKNDKMVITKKVVKD